MKEYFKNIGEAAVSLIKGFTVTFKVMFTKPITVQYPDEKIDISPRFRGMIKLLKDENGNEICDGCGICSVMCPVKVISIETYKDEAGKRKTKSYNINFGRCMFCGLCVENCPKKCLVHTTEYEDAFFTKEELTFTKDRILKQ